MTSEVPDGTWLWLQSLTSWIGTWCFFVGYRLRVHHQIRGLGVLRAMRPKGA